MNNEMTPWQADYFDDLQENKELQYQWSEYVSMEDSIRYYEVDLAEAECELLEDMTPYYYNLDGKYDLLEQKERELVEREYNRYYAQIANRY